jgi:glyoxylase-like metal-dependent hydrolase (beta-lactamase superfamily II)
MVVNPIPFGGDDMLAWPDSLRNLKNLHPAIIVPGHGMLLHGTAFVDLIINAFEEMRAKAQVLVHGPALTDDQVQAKIDLTAMKKRFSGGDVWLGYWFDQYFAPNAVQTYDELRKEGGK